MNIVVGNRFCWQSVRGGSATESVGTQAEKLTRFSPDYLNNYWLIKFLLVVNYPGYTTSSSFSLTFNMVTTNLLF